MRIQYNVSRVDGDISGYVSIYLYTTSLNDLGATENAGTTQTLIEQSIYKPWDFGGNCLLGVQTGPGATRDENPDNELPAK